MNEHIIQKLTDCLQISKKLSMYLAQDDAEIGRYITGEVYHLLIADIQESKDKVDELQSTIYRMLNDKSIL